MYFITKTSESETSIVGTASIKGAAWSKMREAVIEELHSRDALDPFVHDIRTMLTADGGTFSYDGVESRIDSVSGNSAFVDGDGDVTTFRISTYPDKKLFAPVLNALVENYEGYGLTGKQKSQVESLLVKFSKEDA